MFFDQISIIITCIRIFVLLSQNLHLKSFYVCVFILEEVLYIFQHTHSAMTHIMQSISITLLCSLNERNTWRVLDGLLSLLYKTPRVLHSLRFVKVFSIVTMVAARLFSFSMCSLCTLFAVSHQGLFWIHRESSSCDLQNSYSVVLLFPCLSEHLSYLYPPSRRVLLRLL